MTLFKHREFIWQQNSCTHEPQQAELIQVSSECDDTIQLRVLCNKCELLVVFCEYKYGATLCLFIVT
jgi:hypothetical protein